MCVSVCVKSGQLKRTASASGFQLIWFAHLPHFPCCSRLHSTCWPLFWNRNVSNYTKFSVWHKWSGAHPSKWLNLFFCIVIFQRECQNYSFQYLLSNWMWLMLAMCVFSLDSLAHVPDTIAQTVRISSILLYIAFEFKREGDSYWHFKDLLHEIVEYLLNFWHCVKRYSNSILWLANSSAERAEKKCVWKTEKKCELPLVECVRGEKWW